MNDLKSDIERIIREKLRPKIVTDGGDIKLIKIEEGVVTVGLLRTCSCSSDEMLKEFDIVASLESIEGVKNVKTLVF